MIESYKRYGDELKRVRITCEDRLRPGLDFSWDSWLDLRGSLQRDIDQAKTKMWRGVCICALHDAMNEFLVHDICIVE